MDNTNAQTEEKSKTMQLKLFDNVQFIYELVLAKMELEALNLDYQLQDNLRTFMARNLDDIDYLTKRLAYFEKVRSETTQYTHLVKRNRTRSPNQYLTHWIYPYKGKYHPQMIRALLNVIGAEPGNVILDPFVGSGTTLLECQLLGINGVGVDISHACILISKVKCESIEVVNEIEEMRDSLIERGIDGIENIQNEKVRNFYKVAELIAHSDRSRRKKDFTQSFKNNVDKMLASTKDFRDIVDEHNLPLGEVKIDLGDARNLKMNNESVDGIITSPPYSIALNYVKNDEHALEALGYDINEIKEEFIGVRGTPKNKVELYNQDIRKSYEEMYRVLKAGKYCVIVIGNATLQGEEVRTVDKTIEYCKDIGFSLDKNISKIIFGLYNVILKENILIFQK